MIESYKSSCCRIILVCVCIAGIHIAYGQEKFARDSLSPDTLHRDSVHIIEYLLVQQQKQSQVDSALRGQLEAELQKSAGNQVKTRELQAQLTRILA